ncbi:MAG: hypothetical protein HFE66_06265 [Clostridiales bacterium]|jgi:acetyl-CoA carboxylase carboxyltransferase component|nr:hypothetical protein [Clostridiales bacterium]
MDKKNLDAIRAALKSAGVKTAAALRSLLAETDAFADAPAESLTARGRIAALFDEGTFMESGAYVRRRVSELDTAAEDAFEGVICGWGSVAGQLVYAFSQDYSRTKGAISEAHSKKIAEIYRLAIENGAPIIGIFDSAGALMPEGVRALAGYSTLMQCTAAASGVIPQIAIIPGTCAGSAAVVAGMFDFLIISQSKGCVSFNAPFVLGDSEAGKSEFVTKSGLAALTGTGDGDCIAKAKLLLSYLPMNNQEGTITASTQDDLNRLVDLSAYTSSENATDLISAVSDSGSFLELYAAYGKEIVTGFVTLGGTVVGIIANQKCVNGGILTASAARKASRMVTFCDSFHIPVVTLLNSKGPDVSIEAEASTYASELAKLAFAYSSAKTPLITVIVGEAYGAVFSLMGAKALGADVVLALESAKVGVMPASTAVAFLWNDQISEDVSREDLEKQWDETVGSPVAAASAGEIDDIIDGAELRQRIGGAVMMLSAKSKRVPVRRHLNMPL